MISVLWQLGSQFILRLKIPQGYPTSFRCPTSRWFFSKVDLEIRLNSRHHKVQYNAISPLLVSRGSLTDDQSFLPILNISFQPSIAEFCNVIKMLSYIQCLLHKKKQSVESWSLAKRNIQILNQHSKHIKLITLLCPLRSLIASYDILPYNARVCLPALQEIPYALYRTQERLCCITYPTLSILYR